MIFFNRPAKIFLFLLPLLALLMLGQGAFESKVDKTDILVSSGSAWKFQDDASSAASSAWKSMSFNDSLWQEGQTPFEFGQITDDSDVPVRAHPMRANRTIYFRKTFNVANPFQYKSLSLRLRRDDGAIVYLNGKEIVRSNMPDEAEISFDSAAASATASTDEAFYFEYFPEPSALVSGNNLISAELHQRTAHSADGVFDLELKASTSVAVTRGPYLQKGYNDRVTVRWRTNSPTNSRVKFGTLASSLSSTKTDTLNTTEHSVELTGLGSNRKYYYSVGSTSTTLKSGSSYFFQTSTSSTITTRIWALGDSGTANSNATAVRNAYYNFTGSKYTNLMLMLGDNAYDSGKDSEYQQAVFNMYPNTLRQTVLWPTIGNHDTAGSSSPPSSLPYFQMFSLPTKGESGGVASGTEKYYSFNFSNIHFVCLDSMSSSRSTSGAMLTWLKSDLANNTKTWLIAFWHHPPYSKGSHDSDVDTNLVQMRQNALPILEQYGVDLVLSGHSHSYERSFLLDGHYGYSNTLTSKMIKNSGSGKDPNPYRKPIRSSHAGAVYAVAGSSGLTQSGLLNHPAMYISLRNLGSMVIDVNGNRLDARFLRENGGVYDSFTISKY